MGTVACYVRTSTADNQDTAMQRAEISKWLSERGLLASAVWYEDKGFSGSRQSRPAWDRLQKALDSGQHTTLVCYSLDRASRWEDLDAFTVWRLRMRSLGVELVALDGRGTAYSTFGEKLISMVEAYSRDQERQKIVARITAGVRNARRVGVRDRTTKQASGDTRWGGNRVPVGKPGGPKFTPDQESVIVAAIRSGESMYSIADRFNTTRATLYAIMFRHGVSGRMAKRPETASPAAS